MNLDQLEKLFNRPTEQIISDNLETLIEIHSDLLDKFKEIDEWYDDLEIHLSIYRDAKVNDHKLQDAIRKISWDANDCKLNISHAHTQLKQLLGKMKWFIEMVEDKKGEE